MRELIGRLEVVDDDAASALRVIAHFDGLVEERASGPAMLRAAAALAGAPAAWHDRATDATRRFDPLGRSLPADHWADGWPRLALDGGRAGTVWLERSDAPGPLDELILERLGKALGASSTEPRPGGDARWLRMACDPDLTAAERIPALDALRLSGELTVVVASAPLAGARLEVDIDGRAVSFHAPAGPPVVPRGVRAGAAQVDAADLPEGLRQASLAHDLADPAFGDEMPVRWTDLGALASLVGTVAPAAAAATPDVAALEELQDKHPWVAETLNVVASQGSLRQAAGVLHVHHSTLQERMTWLESRLGWSPAKPAGRQRAALALALWRIARSG